MHVLDEWFKNEFDKDETENLFPCWRSVVYVVADKLGGENPAEAKRIARVYQGWMFAYTNIILTFLASVNRV